jgi:alkylation response protein AidB-like acyl-CoA dehydrogenase
MDKELVARLLGAAEALLIENHAYQTVLEYPADRRTLRENARVLLFEPRAFVDVRQEFQAIRSRLAESTAPEEIVEELVKLLESGGNPKIDG